METMSPGSSPHPALQGQWVEMVPTHLGIFPVTRTGPRPVGYESPAFPKPQFEVQQRQ